MVRKGGLGGVGVGGASVSWVYHWFSVLLSSCSFESATGMFCSNLYGICFGWGMVLGFWLFAVICMSAYMSSWSESINCWDMV